MGALTGESNRASTDALDRADLSAAAADSLVPPGPTHVFGGLGEGGAGSTGVRPAASNSACTAVMTRPLAPSHATTLAVRLLPCSERLLVEQATRYEAAGDAALAARF